MFAQYPTRYTLNLYGLIHIYLREQLKKVSESIILPRGIGHSSPTTTEFRGTRSLVTASKKAIHLERVAPDCKTVGWF